MVSLNHMKTNPNLSGWWTVAEAASVAKLHPRTIHRWIKQGRVRAFGPPRCTRVLLGDILGERQPQESLNALR
jgi:hypothetical protein